MESRFRIMGLKSRFDALRATLIKLPAPDGDKAMTANERQAWLPHIQHRLTLLRTFRDRLADSSPVPGDYHRCCKDSALISIRLFVEALGLCCHPTSDKLKKRSPQTKKDDDIWFEDIGGCSVEPKDLTPTQHVLLSRMLRRANKELAHLTKTQDEEFNRREKLIAAIDLVESLVNRHFYIKIGAEL